VSILILGGSVISAVDSGVVTLSVYDKTLSPVRDPIVSKMIILTHISHASVCIFGTFAK